METTSDAIQTEEYVSRDASDAGNASDAVLTDADIQRVQEIADAQTTDIQGAIEDGIGNVSANVSATIGEAVPLAIENARSADAQEVQTVTLDTEQWQTLVDHNQYVHDSMAMQCTLIIFMLMIVAALVGMRFFSEFTRGFRHG